MKITTLYALVLINYIIPYTNFIFLCVYKLQEAVILSSKFELTDLD